MYVQGSHEGDFLKVNHTTFVVETSQCNDEERNKT